MIILLIIAEILLLFFISRAVNSSIFGFFYLLFHSKRIAMMFTTLIFFPGTVVHELSHLLTAEVTGVKTGTLSLVPEFAKEDEIQAGSVEISKTDPFRRTLIGLAPLLVGLATVSLLAWEMSLRFPAFVRLLSQPEFWIKPDFYLMLLFGYLLFTISNNMFPSDVDMVGVPPVIILLLLLGGAAYVVGFRISINGTALTVLETGLLAFRNNIGIVLGVNVVLFAIARTLLFFLMKKRRVHFSSK